MISSVTSPPAPALSNGRRLRLAPGLVLLACVALILSDNLVNIGRTVDELTKFYLVWRLTPLDFGICLLFAWGAYYHRQLRKFFLKFPILLLIAAIIFATIVGVLRQQRTGTSWLLYDVRILMCLLGGIIMGSIMVRTGQFLRLVAILALVSTALLAYSGMSTNFFKDSLGHGLGNIRNADPNIFYYWEFLLIPCGILGVKRAATTTFERVAFWVSLTGLGLLGVIIAATRSCLIVLVILVSLLVLAWMKKARVKRLKGAVTTFVVVVGVGGAIFFTRSLFKTSEVSTIVPFEESLSSFAVIERVRTSTAHDEDNLNYRGEEVRQLFREMEGMDYVMGKGMGSTIAVQDTTAVIDPGSIERVPGLHISIFNFLLKFGALIFLLMLGLVLVRWPLAFVRALLRKGKDLESKATLICYPAAGAATSLMFMSGGFTPQMFLWFGVLYAYYIDTITHRPNTGGIRETGGTREASAPRSAHAFRH